MKIPKLSIIIPVYNSGEKAQKIAAQILKQKFHDFELILINDGSTDNSEKILNNLAQKNQQIRYFSQENSGAAAARNLGIKKSRGEFLMFFDSDDEIAKNMITKMIQKISQTKSDLITCGAKYLNYQNGEKKSESEIFTNKIIAQKKSEKNREFILRLLGSDGRLYSIWNKIYRGEIIRTYNIFFPTGVDFGEDLIFNLNYLLYAEKIDFLYEPLYFYKFDSENGTFGKSSLIYKNRQENFAEVENFAKKFPEKMSLAEKDYLNWLKFYWFYSFSLAVAHAKISRREKIKKIKSAKNSEKFVAAKTKEFIGQKKYFLEKFFLRLIRWPRIFYFVIFLSDKLKNARIFAKPWRKIVGGAMK